MAAYRSSSLASATPKSSASVVVCHQRVVASFVWGATMREATMASASSRSRQGLEAINEASPRRCIAIATACTWPCGRERVISKACDRGTKVSPCSERRMISISGSGRCEMLPSVSFLTVPPSR